MSTAKRAYDMLRGYVNNEWDRIKGVRMDDAEQELEEALANPIARPKAPTGADERTPEEAAAANASVARKVLGVSETADFAEIRACFDRIIKRTDPANFPEGSPEARQAETIHRRVHQAYGILTEGMDATEKRFRTLEID